MKKIIFLLLILVCLHAAGQMSKKDSLALDSVNRLLVTATYSQKHFQDALEKAQAGMSYKDYGAAEKYFIYFVQLMQSAWLEENKNKKQSK